MTQTNANYQKPLFSEGSEEENSEEIPFSLQDLWHPLVTWRWLIACCLVLGVLIGFRMALMPLKYSATSSLRIQPGAASAYQISPAEALSGDSGVDEKINTELAIMQSRTITLEVAKRLDLANDPGFWGKRSVKQSSLSDPSMREQLFKRMRTVVQIVHEPKTEIVVLVATTTSPKLSANILNELMNEYVAHIFQVRYGSTERVSKWLVAQLDDLKSKVEQDQGQLVSLQGKLGVLGLDAKNSDYLLADSLQGITRASGDATISRIVAEARLRFLEDADPNLIEGEQPILQSQGSSQTGLLQSLRNSQAQAKAAYADLTAKYGDNYPEVKEARARLDALQAEVLTEQTRIVSQARLSYSAAKANENMTEKALADRKTEAFRSHDDMVKYVILQRQYESDRVLYESLMQRLRIAGINAGLESAQVDVVDMADLPTLPRRPSPWQWIAIGSLGFLLFGCLLAEVVDLLDARLDTVEDTQKLLRLPLLSVLPLSDLNLEGKSFDAITRENSSYSEGMQLLRSSVLLSRAGFHPRSILITSTIPGEGKSTVARNFAGMLAMHKSRVLLIDGDLHKGSQSRSLGLSRSPGLSDLLSTDLQLHSAIVPIPTIEGLYFLPAGPSPPQPAILLSSERMKMLLDDAKDQFDFIVVDTAPVLGVSDPVVCVPLMDTVLFVVRQKLPNGNQAKHAVDLLRRGRGTLGGFIMNGVDNRRGVYAGYYNYAGYGTEKGRTVKR